MREFFVDFNMVEADGRTYPTRVSPDDMPAIGEEVIAFDGEGLECRALVRAVIRKGQIAILDPVDNSWAESTRRLEPSSRLD